MFVDLQPLCNCKKVKVSELHFLQDFLASFLLMTHNMAQTGLTFLPLIQQKPTSKFDPKPDMRNRAYENKLKLPESNNNILLYLQLCTCNPRTPFV